MENKIEDLTEFLNTVGNNRVEYIQNNKDYLDAYFDLVEIWNIYYGELDDNTKNLLKSLVEYKDIDFLFNNDLVDVDIYSGISRRSNEIWSFNISEEEEQITGMYDHETKSDCKFSDLCKGMTDDEINQAKENCEYYIRDEYLYIDMSYSRVSFVLNESKFLEMIDGL